MLALLVLIADLGCVLVFATVGRVSHAEGLSITGVLVTAWPFLAGATLGFVAGRARRLPLALTSGLASWAGAVFFGTLFRAWTGAGTPISFVIVTAVVLAILLLGWRLTLRAITSRRHPTTPHASASSRRA